MNNKRKLEEYEITYHANKDRFPPSLKEEIDKFLELKDFHFGTRKNFIEEGKPLLQELMFRQFEQFKGLSDPLALEYTDTNHETILWGMIEQLNNLCKMSMKKLSVLERYPKLERWRAIYLDTPKPASFDDEDRKFYPYLSDEEWAPFKEHENKLMRNFFLWEQKKKNDFFDIIQPLAFSYLPELSNLEGDFWVIYAVCITDNYEQWKILNEHLEIILDYEMPMECIKLKISELSELINRDYFNKFDEVKAKRDLKISLYKN